MERRLYSGNVRKYITNRRYDSNGVWIIQTGRYEHITGLPYVRVPTIEQCLDLNIDYLPYEDWYKAEEGGWIELSDGYATQVLRRNNNPKFSYIRTIFGTYVVTDMARVNYHFRRKEPNSIRSIRKSTISGVVIPSKSVTLSERQYQFTYKVAHSIAKSGDPNYEENFKSVFSSRGSRMNLARLLAMPKIRNSIFMLLSEILKESGADTSWAIKQVMDMVKSESTPPVLKWEILQEIFFLNGHMTSSIAIALPGMYSRMKMLESNGKVEKSITDGVNVEDI